MTLTEQDKRNIIGALATVTPCGGGSALNTLAHQLSKEWGIEIYSENGMELILYMSDTVIDDAQDAGVVKRLEEAL